MGCCCLWTFLFVVYWFWPFFSFPFIHFWRRRTSWTAFHGEWAVVTGASVGIGRELCVALAKRGLNVAMIARSEEKMRETAHELEQLHGVKTRVIPADLLDPCVFERIERELAGCRVSVLLNNVGAGPADDLPMKPWIESDKHHEERCRMLNFTCCSDMTRMLLPSMIDSRKGRILNISSLASLYGPMLSHYSTEKAKLNAFSRVLDTEVRSHGVRVNSYLLGLVSTPGAGNPPTSKLHCCSAAQCAEDILNKFCALDASVVTPYWGHALEVLLMQTLPERVVFMIFKMALQKAMDAKKAKEQ